jgi:hypothetical protein
MRRSLFVSFAVVLFAAVAVPSAAVAQQWSAEEQELLDNIAMCWDAWLEATEAGDIEVWSDKCGVAKDVSMWWTEFGAPAGMRMEQRYWMKHPELDEDWLDIRPVAVRIWDDVAMVQFYGYWLANTAEGQAITEYKRTEVFRKVDGRWIFLGGQGTPASAADADPYK